MKTSTAWASVMLVIGSVAFACTVLVAWMTPTILRDDDRNRGPVLLAAVVVAALGLIAMFVIAWRSGVLLGHERPDDDGPVTPER
jgi:hypothetical protein